MSNQLPTEGNLKKKTVFALHGIRTYGGWRQTFADLINIYAPSLLLRQDGWHFGVVSAPGFLWPWTRGKKLAWFIQKYQEEMEKSDIRDNLKEGEYPSIVAHSFGTYILGYSLLQYEEMRFDRVLLCGSILPEDFPWDRIVNNGQVQELRNECGKLDFWSGISGKFVKKCGAAGKNGIDSSIIKHANGKVTNAPFTYHKHCDFFQKMHMTKYWLPFLQQRSISLHDNSVGGNAGEKKNELNINLNLKIIKEVIVTIKEPSKIPLGDVRLIGGCVELFKEDPKITDLIYEEIRKVVHKEVQANRLSNKQGE